MHLSALIHANTGEDDLEGVIDSDASSSNATVVPKLEALGALASGIAHEINSPIQYIGNNLQFIADGVTSLEAVLKTYADLCDVAQNQDGFEQLVDNVERSRGDADLEFLIEELPEAIRQSLDGVRQVARLVSAMKEFAHPGSTDKEPADINETIETTVALSRNEWKYDASIEFDLAEDLPMVDCQAGELSQVWLNLIVNAAQAIRAKPGEGQGRIWIKTALRENAVEIAFIDNGIGIPDDIRTQIFEPFFTTKDVGEGSGQGLAISKDIIVERHGGELHVTSEDGLGTGFVVRIPIRSCDDALIDQHGAVA